MSKSFRRAGGFTFIEVLASLAILSGVIVTVIITLNLHLSAVRGMREEAIAVLLARQKIEDMNINGLPQEKEGWFLKPYDSYMWGYESQGTQIPGIKKINLRVSWDNGAKGIVIETYRLGA
jgi:general secretion pathway protein I